MITIQHQETEKSGVFEAWMRATEEGACTEPVQVGEMTYQRPTPQRMIIDPTRVFDGFEGNFDLLFANNLTNTASSCAKYVRHHFPCRNGLFRF